MLTLPHRFYLPPRFSSQVLMPHLPTQKSGGNTIFTVDVKLKYVTYKVNLMNNIITLSTLKSMFVRNSRL